MRKGFSILTFLIVICGLALIPQDSQSVFASNDPESTRFQAANAGRNQSHGRWKWLPDEFLEGSVQFPPNGLNEVLAPAASPVLDPIGPQTVDELTELTFTASASDPDPGDTLTYSLTGSNVPSGASIDPSSGVFSWTPTEAEGPGNPSFDVCVSDATVQVCETITVTVNEVNILPTLAPISDKTVDELTLLTFTASATDPDLPPNSLTFSLQNNPPSGATIGSTSGVFNWTPTEAQGPSNPSFDICVSDGSIQVCDTITVTVNEVNTGPTLTRIDNQSVNELSELTFTATASDPDPLDTLTYSLEGSVPSGASIGSSSGVFSWTPTEGQGPGIYFFDVCVNDGALQDCDNVKFTVNEVNAPPILAAIGSKSVDELTSLSFTASASDPDIPPNTLSYSLAGSVPSGASIGSSNGSFNWTPTEAQGPNTYSFDVCVSDSAAQDCENISVTVYEVNAPPTLNPIGNKTVNEGALLTFTASATDPDPSPTLTFSLQGIVPAGASIGSSSGVFTWTPSEAQGPGSPSINVCVSDGVLQDCESIKVTVNEVNSPPNLSTIGSKSVNELTLLTFTALATDSDIPANSLTFSLQNSPPSGASIGSSSGIFNWTPSEAQGPSAPSFNVCVSDGTVQYCETITVTVNELNTPPILSPIGPKIVDELTLLTFTASASDSDLPANPLTFSLQGAVPSGASIGSTTGLFNWTPSEAQGPSSPSFNVCVSDSTIQDCETITVTVNEVNAPPTITDITDKITNEDTATSAIPFTIGDAETLAVDLIVSATSSNQTLVPDINISLGGIGSVRTITITPTLNQFGTTTLTVTVTDGNGAPASDTFLLTVNSVNDLPTITDVLDQVTDEDTPTPAIPFTVGDTETPAANLVMTGSSSNPLLVPDTNITFGGLGSARTVTITPVLNGYGSTTITLTATDLDGGFVTDTFLLTVNPILDLPTITDIPNQVTDEDTPLSSLPFTVDDAETLAEFLVVQATSSNQVLVPDSNITTNGFGAARTITVSPDTNQTGVTTITVTVIDSDGGTAVDTFLMTVIPVNDPPVALSDFYEVVHDKTLKIGAPGLLGNDSDVDGDTLLPFLVDGQGPSHGTLTLRNSGSFDYKPHSGFIGSDSFQYFVSDDRPSGSLTSNIAQVSINVYDANSPRVSWMVPVNNGEQYDVECEEIELEVEAIDDLNVDYVVLSYYDYVQQADVLIETINSPPYRTTFNTCILNPEFNQINAIAYDLAGNNSGYPAFIWLYHYAYTFYLPSLEK